MNNQRLPWDEMPKGTAMLNQEVPPQLSARSKAVEEGTTDGALKYELGKPVRITIKGDLKK